MAVKKHASQKRQVQNAVRTKTQRLRAPNTTPATDGAPSPTPPLRADTQALGLPEDLVAEAAADMTDRLPSVMLVITVLGVLFIGVIAWLVAQMPAK